MSSTIISRDDLGMSNLAFDEMELAIHSSDYYALHHRVRSLIEMYSSHMARRTDHGLVFVIAKNRLGEIQEAMAECANPKEQP